MKATKDPRWPDFLRTTFVLATLLFAGNYLYARLFGVYDDDFIFTVPPFFWSRAEAWGHIKEALLGWPQGRPVGFALTYLVSYISAQSSSLGLGYLIGFGILLLNATLLHRLARRFISAPAALFAASVFVLYPADTGRVILMHRVNLHLNVTFVLLALLCYVRGWRWIAYPIAALCFMIHEPVFAVFLGAPLLVASFKELSWKRCLTHGLLCTATVAILLIVRRHIGDPRLTETLGNPLEVVQRIAQALYIGPRTVFVALLTRPLEALYATDAQLWIVVMLCASAFFVFGSDQRLSVERPPEETRGRALCLAMAGTVCFLLGYLLCFRDDYWPPVMTIGRISGYHISGSIGASLLLGAIFGWLLELDGRLRTWLIAGAALYCGLLVSFGVEVQRIDYVKHTEQQALFWRTIIDTSGEWSPDTVILVDITGNDPSRPFTPGMPLWWTVNFAPTLLEHLVEWPATWAKGIPSKPGPHPRAYGFQPNFETMVENGAVVVKTPAWLSSNFWPRVKNHDFIYFRFAGGRMTRVTEPVEIGGQKMYPLDYPKEARAQLHTTSFYDLLFVKETHWQTILKAHNYPR